MLAKLRDIFNFKLFNYKKRKNDRTVREKDEIIPREEFIQQGKKSWKLIDFFLGKSLVFARKKKVYYFFTRNLLTPRPSASLSLIIFITLLCADEIFKISEKWKSQISSDFSIHRQHNEEQLITSRDSQHHFHHFLIFLINNSTLFRCVTPSPYSAAESTLFNYFKQWKNLSWSSQSRSSRLYLALN